MAFKIVSLAALFALFFLDMLWSSKSLSLKSAALRLACLALCAAIFGWILSAISLKDCLNFFSGYITEYSLSIDNLFVYGMILQFFKVPEELSNWSLSAGIFLAVVIRLVLIVLGARLLSDFSFLFFPCGIFLIAVAAKNAAASLKKRKAEGERKEGLWGKISKFLPQGGYRGKKLFYKDEGRILFTPLLGAMASIALADAFFSLDSIPAILGITTDVFVVLTSNFFALIGLKELYFLLIKGLSSLKYLPLGISAILAFIGVKLLLEALSSNSLKFINGGRPVPVPSVPSWVTLCVISSILALCALASLAASKKSKVKLGGKSKPEK